MSDPTERFADALTTTGEESLVERGLSVDWLVVRGTKGLLPYERELSVEEPMPKKSFARPEAHEDWSRLEIASTISRVLGACVLQLLLSRLDAVPDDPIRRRDNKR